MESHTIPVGCEFQIHQIEIPKIGSNWSVAKYDTSILRIVCEIWDARQELGDGAMHKFVFQAMERGYSEIHLEHKNSDGDVIETSSYGVTSE